MDEHTSAPGPGNDPIEADFEKQLQDEGLELEGRPGAKKDPAPEPAKVDPEKPADKEPDADPAKDPKKPEEGKDKDPKDPAKKDEEGNEPWRQMIAKRRQDQAKSQGKDPAKDPDPKPDPSKPKTDPEPSAAKNPELTDEQKTLADKYGIEHEDYFKMFPPAKEKEVIKEGLSEEDRKALEEYRTERDGLLIEKGYNQDFDTNVLPLLREEYPKGLTDDKIAEVRKSIMSKLQDEKFSLVPLDVLYLGDKTFRGLIKPPVSGPDTGSKVPAKGDPSKIYDFDTATEDDVKRPDFPFAEYSEYMAKKEKKK